MGPWRTAAVLVVLGGAAALLVRSLSPDLFSPLVFPRGDQSLDVRDAVRTALAGLDGGKTSQIHILSESAAVDRSVADALSPPPDHVRVATLRRDFESVDRAAHAGELLALQNGRRYLELLGFALEWLPQPAETAAFPWARVRRRLRCAGVREDRWSPLPGVEYTGRLGLQMAPSLVGKLVLVIGDRIALDIEAAELDDMPVALHREVLRAGPVSGVPVELWSSDGDPTRAPQAVIRLTIAALPVRERLVSLRLGRRAPRVLARLVNYEKDARVRVCAAPLGVDDAFDTAGALVITPDTPEYFGTGWYGREFASPALGSVRWMKSHGAILVPSARRGAVEVVMTGAPNAAGGVATEAGSPPRTADADAATMILSVNDVFAGDPVALRSGPSTYRWRVPETAWLAATNELTFTVSRSTRLSDRDTRDVAFALRRLEVIMK